MATLSNIQTLNQTQKLQLAPQLQNAIKLLQLSSIELSEKIETEINENPFLERLSESESSSQEKEKTALKDRNSNLIDDTKSKSKGKSDSEYQSQYEDELFEDSSDIGFYKKSTRVNYEGSNNKQQFLENAIPTKTTLYEHLINQLRLIDITDEEFQIGEAIIVALDHDGYFKDDPDEFAKTLETEKETLLSVLSKIQTLEPPGIAARDLKEALLIQIDQIEPETDEQKKTFKIARLIIEDHLKNLKIKKYKEIANKLKISLDDVEKAHKVITSLEPIPARNFDFEQIKYIIPDVYVQKVDGGFAISMNDDFIPNLTLNSDYKKMMRKQTVNEDTKKFLDSKYSEAKLLIFSIEKRNSTLYKVVEALIEYQHDFFDKGPQYIKPLTLKTIADKIEMHESTVSRITSSKYIQTPWGIYELKYFFSSALRKSDGSVKSSQSIKEIIKEIIENESDKALSDSKIVEILSNQGIKIARRTVTKYRRSLNILPSFHRKVD